MSVSICNILLEPPKDYCSGMSWDGANYMSHNRSNGGVCEYWNGTTWVEMKTENGGVGSGDPPLCYHDGKFYNQYKIGQDADS